MSSRGRKWTVDRRLLLAGSVIVGAVAAAICYILILPTSSYHFQEVILNVYGNRSMDFSANVTGLVRGLGVVALGCMVLGLLVGSLIGLSRAEGAFKPQLENFAPNTRIDVALLRSGLVSGTATVEGVRFELTERGKRFIQEYEKIGCELRESPTCI